MASPVFFCIKGLYLFRISSFPGKKSDKVFGHGPHHVNSRLIVQVQLWTSQFEIEIPNYLCQNTSIHMDDIRVSGP